MSIAVRTITNEFCWASQRIDLQEMPIKIERLIRSNPGNPRALNAQALYITNVSRDMREDKNR